jgi:hypothetical protein
MSHYFRDYDLASKKTIVNCIAKDIINNEVHLRIEVLDELLEALLHERNHRDREERQARDYERNAYLKTWNNEHPEEK